MRLDGRRPGVGDEGLRCENGSPKTVKRNRGNEKAFIPNNARMKARGSTPQNSCPIRTRGLGWPHPPLVGGVKTRVDSPELREHARIAKATRAGSAELRAWTWVDGRARTTRYPDSKLVASPPPSQTQCAQWLASRHGSSSLVTVAQPSPVPTGFPQLRSC